MKIAFIDHRFHDKTGSTKFFLEQLGRLGEIDRRIMDDWSGDAAWLSSFRPDDYDVIVVWQIYPRKLRTRLGNHPNVTFVPMYDSMLGKGRSFLWDPRYASGKVLCFCWKLQEEVGLRSAVSSVFQYHPPPAAGPVEVDGIRAFFWNRTSAVSLEMVLKLLGSIPIDELNIHDCPDPSEPHVNLDRALPTVQRLRTSTWFETLSEYTAHLRRYNVFFAPRRFEGIGMSFLDAMANGLCVIAPNSPTMNEYISDRTNGLLYDPSKPEVVDASAASILGQRAWESAVRGHDRWLNDVPRLLEFLGTRTDDVRCARQIGRSIPFSTAVAPAPEVLKRRSASIDVPEVAVVTVVRQARGDLETTVDSVLAQDHPSLEYLVFDGGSTDGTAEYVRSIGDRLAYWQSKPDLGVYYAMNESLERVRAEWVLFMNAGDTFVSRDALRRLLSRAPSDAGVVYGHHLYRRLDGLFELHRAAGFESTWRRLQEGRLGSDWLRGIPGHQATAVRTDLLRRLRFDTRYRIAADHDLLFRAMKQSVRFYNADELTSIYVAGGLSARQFPTCVREWADIASTHGDRIGALKFFAPMLIDAEAMRHRGPSRWNLALDVVGKLPILSRNPSMVTALGGALRVGQRAITGLNIRSGRQLIRLEEPSLPPFVAGLDGVSSAERWGRWSDGGLVRIWFHTQLPTRFDLVVRAHAFGPNVRAPVIVRAGSFEGRMCFDREPAQRVELAVETDEPEYLIELEIPHPTSPAELPETKNNDARHLGLALKEIEIRSKESWLETVVGIARRALARPSRS